VSARLFTSGRKDRSRFDETISENAIVVSAIDPISYGSASPMHLCSPHRTSADVPRSVAAFSAARSS
jgi:hypothetical protein